MKQPLHANAHLNPAVLGSPDGPFPEHAGLFKTSYWPRQVEMNTPNNSFKKYLKCASLFLRLELVKLTTKSERLSVPRPHPLLSHTSNEMTFQKVIRSVPAASLLVPVRRPFCGLQIKIKTSRSNLHLCMYNFLQVRCFNCPPDLSSEKRSRIM